MPMTTRLWLGKPSQAADSQARASAVSAQLDPERRHLLDANKLDDGRTLAPDTSATSVTPRVSAEEA